MNVVKLFFDSACLLFAFRNNVWNVVGGGGILAAINALKQM
jgi:hypothetical protein